MQIPLTLGAIGSQDASDAEAVLNGIAEGFLRNASMTAAVSKVAGQEPPSSDAKYRMLVEQLPAVIFMVSLDRGSAKAYVSPQIERMLGFSQEEWLEDPIRWFERIHPTTKSAGASRRRKCSSPASRLALCIALSRATAG